MKPVYCEHQAEYVAATCSHIFHHDILEGVKKYTGEGLLREYLCKQCRQEEAFVPHYVCAACEQVLDEEGDWSITGMPEVLHRPRPFHFSAREVQIEALADARILAFEPVPQSRSDAVVFTSAGALLKIDILTGTARQVAAYPDDVIARAGLISLKVSKDARYVAVTSCPNSQNVPALPGGLVASLDTGAILLPLSCGDYHTEQTDFPVEFIEYQGQTLVIHATDWNRLDVTNPVTGELLTPRDFESTEARELGEVAEVFTEWNGYLRVSPDQKRVATIGWVWHPVGVAYSWDAQTWLSDNVWEPDFGSSKKLYACWEYFWHSPFVWLDSQRLCIWGYERLQTGADIPLPSAAIYDGASGELLTWFAGPTMDQFYFDKYLFSGSADGEGLSVWSIEEGALLHEQKDITVMGYHPGTKEFLSRHPGGTLLFTKWEERSDEMSSYCPPENG